MVDAEGDRARRLGAVLWEFQVTFPRHDPEDEAHWKQQHPEFSAEIAGFAEAARAAPIPDGELDEDTEREIASIVDAVLEAEARFGGTGVGKGRAPAKRAKADRGTTKKPLD